jgi:hypothetical protein
MDYSSLPRRSTTHRRSTLPNLTTRRCRCAVTTKWTAPGTEDTKLGVLIDPEVRHGASGVYAGVQARSRTVDEAARRLVCAGIYRPATTEEQRDTQLNGGDYKT